MKKTLKKSLKITGKKKLEFYTSKIYIKYLKHKSIKKIEKIIYNFYILYFVKKKFFEKMCSKYSRNHD